MRILLFGSTGLIGTAISTVCEKMHIECVALSHADGDVCNPPRLQLLMKEHNPDVVINATGLVGINQCEDDPRRAFNVNTIAVSYLAELCEKSGAILVQPSTHNVFDGKKDGYYTEDDCPCPLQIYGISKYASEKIASKCGKYYIVRLPTLFGKRINGRSAFPDKIVDWIREGKEFNISYDKIDSPSYSIDIAYVILQILAVEPECGIYHIANSGSTNYSEFVQEISKIIGVEAKATSVEEVEFQTRAPNALKTAMASVKIPSLRSWQEALREYLNGS